MTPANAVVVQSWGRCPRCRGPFRVTRLEAEKARRALRYFERTYRTEEASFLRFQRLPEERLATLRAW